MYTEKDTRIPGGRYDNSIVSIAIVCRRQVNVCSGHFTFAAEKTRSSFVWGKINFVTKKLPQVVYAAKNICSRKVVNLRIDLKPGVGFAAAVF